MANKDLVVKMTINSNDFDNGLKNAKASMNKFNADTKGMAVSFKNVIGGMTKAFGALGIAVGGAQMFKSFISSTQTMGDAWNNTMVTAKTSFQVFETAVASGTGTILSNFKESIRAAREFAEAMDSLGSAQISNKYARMKYVTPFNEAMTRYREAKTGGNNTAMSFAASDMERYINAYSDNASNIMTTSRKAVGAKLSAYTGGFVNEGNLNKYLDQLYLEIVNGVFPPILQDFNNLEVERRKGDYFYNEAKENMEKKYGEGWRREAEAMKALSQINDETLNEMLGIIQSYDQVRNEINSMRRQMNRFVNGKDTTKTTLPTTTTTTTESDGPKLTEEQLAEFMRLSFQESLLQGDRERDAMLIDIEIPNEDIIEEDTDRIVQAVTEAQEKMKLFAGETAMAFEATRALAGAFDAFGDVTDSTIGKVAKGLGGIIGQIIATVQAMMTLAGAETVEGVVDVFANTNGDVWTKLAMAAVGLAGILSIVASAKSSFAGSYADGGIVGGSSYSGDRLWARVNSGEMILNQSQQAALFGGGSGRVQFVIEGSQLKGVLDNYNKIENL
jgi:hypothetical protein